jgi:hypothetical protein
MPEQVRKAKAFSYRVSWALNPSMQDWRGQDLGMRHSARYFVQVRLILFATSLNRRPDVYRYTHQWEDLKT